MLVKLKSEKNYILLSGLGENIIMVQKRKKKGVEAEYRLIPHDYLTQ